MTGGKSLELIDFDYDPEERLTPKTQGKIDLPEVKRQ